MILLADHELRYRQEELSKPAALELLAWVLLPLVAAAVLWTFHARTAEPAAEPAAAETRP